MRLIDADKIEYDFNIKTYADNRVMITKLLADKDTIDAMPTVEPKRKTGKWEIYIISMLDGEGCKCSECESEGVPYWNFCPNCGADMRGEENDS